MFIVSSNEDVYGINGGGGGGGIKFQEGKKDL